MKIYDIVLVISGKEKGKYYLVLDADTRYVYIVNGSNRIISNPKKKNIKHVQKVGKTTNPIGDKVLHDCDIIKILSDYRNDKREASLHCQKKMW